MMEKRHIWRPDFDDKRQEYKKLFKPYIQNFIDTFIDNFMDDCDEVLKDIINDAVSEAWQFFIKKSIVWPNWNAPGVIDIEVLEYQDVPEFGLHFDIAKCLKNGLDEMEDAKGLIEWASTLEYLALWIRHKVENL